MAIDIQWQDESGNVLAQYNGPALEARLLHFFPASAACLSAIDPIGDTVFNQIQIKRLATELDALLAPGSKNLPVAFIAVRQFIESTIGHVHTYLKFIGD